MDDPVTSARQARENLAKGLAALQSPGVPGSLLNVAEPVALAMRALHSIEATRAASITLEAPVALDQVRRGLAMLQELPNHHAAVQEATVAVASSLSLVHGLVRSVLPAPTAGPLPASAPLPTSVPISVPLPESATLTSATEPTAPRVVEERPALPRVIEISAPRHAPAAPVDVRAVASLEVKAGSVVPPTQLSARGPGGFDQTVRYASPEARDYALLQREERRGRPEAPAVPPLAASNIGRDRSHARTTPSAGMSPLADMPAPQPLPTAPAAPARGQQFPAAAPAAPAPREAPTPTPAVARAGRAERKTVPESRQPGSGTTNFSAELGAHSPTNFYKGLSGNDVIESGGIFIATYRMPNVGAPVVIKVTLPGGYEFQAAGVVQWTRVASEAGPDSPPGFGARLTGLSAEGRQLIYRYVRNREPFFHDDL